MAVTNYCKLGAFKWHKGSILQLCRLEVRQGSHWDRIKVSTGLCFFLQALEENPFLYFSGFMALSSIFKVSHMAPLWPCFHCHISDSPLLLPSSTFFFLGGVSYLCPLPLLRTLVIRLLLLGESFSHVPLFVTLWAVACQAPLSMGFSRQ